MTTAAKLAMQGSQLRETESSNLPAKSTSRFTELDALRGIAAIIVAVGHFCYGFLPEFHAGARNTPMFAAFNGTAAVTFFFVLSGFVLSIGTLISGRTSALGLAALRRWPRLAGPVLISCLLSAVIGILGLYFNHEASGITGSSWLAKHDYHSGDAPSLWGAFLQGAVLTFWVGENEYNSVLWTMRYEFYGSFAAFGLAWLLVEIRQPVIQVCVLITATAIAYSVDPHFACFTTGVALALAHARGLIPSISGLPAQLIAAALMVVVIYLWGYGARGGVYAPMSFLSAVEARLIVVYMVAAIFIIAGVLSLRPAAQFLSGRFGVLLGKLSFPIYLTHLLVIASFGSMTFVVAHNALPPAFAVMAAAIVSIVATGIASWCIMLFDDWWQALLKKPRFPA